MKKVVFRGAGVAIVTPFTADGINFPEFGRLIDDQIARNRRHYRRGDDWRGGDDERRRA